MEFSNNYCIFLVLKRFTSYMTIYPYEFLPSPYISSVLYSKMKNSSSQGSTFGERIARLLILKRKIKYIYVSNFQENSIQPGFLKPYNLTFLVHSIFKTENLILYRYYVLKDFIWLMISEAHFCLYL